MAYHDPSDPEYIDAAGIGWHFTHAEERGSCHHCGETYRTGDEKALHASCWDLHEGFSLAMTKDD